MVGPVAEVAMRAEQRIPSPEGSGGGEAGMARTFHLLDLSSLSISSVGPLFSIAATGGVMAAASGYYTVLAIVLISVPFIISAFVFRLLNRHFPHAGASYHWAGRILGRRASRFQACVLLVAYFASIPPIIIPAATYTKALLLPHWQAPPVGMLGLSAFWVAFALIPLLAGGRPTARITQAFLALEAVAILVIIGVAIARWPALHVAIHPGPLPIGGLFASAIIASTILDGWEIDSYAAEESRRPRDHPGVGGIVGAIGALLFYDILYPLMLGETPLHLLANSTDPLAVWSHRLVPGAPWIMLVPILLSTAGGLWLTSFILTRALYAMGRERLIPSGFARLNGRHVPHVAIVASLGLAAAVVALQLLVSSLGSFFTLVLSAAGFFLLAEFFLDSVTAAVFLTIGHKRLPDVRLQPHGHRLLLLGSLFSSMVMAALLATFFVYGPKAVGGGVDETFGVLLALGLVFAWWTRRRALTPVVFAGNDVPAGGAETS